jgi:hypothetical protein
MIQKKILLDKKRIQMMPRFPLSLSQLKQKMSNQIHQKMMPSKKQEKAISKD